MLASANSAYLPALSATARSASPSCLTKRFESVQIGFFLLWSLFRDRRKLVMRFLSGFNHFFGDAPLVREGFVHSPVAYVASVIPLLLAIHAVSSEG